jgi:hypothetical protein
MRILDGGDFTPKMLKKILAQSSARLIRWVAWESPRVRRTFGRWRRERIVEPMLDSNLKEGNPHEKKHFLPTRSCLVPYAVLCELTISGLRVLTTINALVNLTHTVIIVDMQNQIPPTQGGCWKSEIYSPTS